MTVAASHVVDRGGQGQVLVICTFHGPQEGTEIRQITELEVEKVFLRHDIMIALSEK
jgi:hypothetical protein